MSRYDDIIHLARPQPSHPKMRREDRAKLFAPFAALAGHDEAVHARDKVLVTQTWLTAHTQAILDRKLQRISKGDRVTAIWFVPLKRVHGELLGEYRTVTDQVTKLDIYERTLTLGGAVISFEDLADLRGEGLEELEEEDAYPL